MITMDNKYYHFDFQKQFGKKIRDFRRKPKVDINDTYGTYDISGEMSDYTTVEDTNAYYGQ